MIEQAKLAEVVALDKRLVVLSKAEELKVRAARLKELEAELAEATLELHASAAFRRWAAKRDSMSGTISHLPALATVLEADEITASRTRLLDALKKAYRVDPTVEAGKCRLVVEKVGAVSWEGFWDLISAIPLVAKRLASIPEAVELVRQARDKDPAASFVTQRISRLDVLGG